MSDYTPTAGIVKAAYMVHKFQHEHVELEDSAAEFDRWLAKHDRQIAAAAWDEGRESATHDYELDLSLVNTTNPYQKEQQ